MGKTYKDQKNYPRYRKAKCKSLSRKYLNARQGKGVRELDFQSAYDEGGVHCAYCGSEAEGEQGRLLCEECGLLDDGRTFKFQGAA